MESIKQTVGENLKHVCKTKRIKNKQIAEFMGVTESSVSHWFQGDNSIDIDNLYKLCKYLGVSLDQIFGIDPLVSDILNQDECDVIEAYRKAGSETKDNIRKILGVSEIKKCPASSAG